VLTSKHANKQTKKQILLKTSTSLRYATPVETIYLHYKTITSMSIWSSHITTLFHSFTPFFHKSFSPWSSLALSTTDSMEYHLHHIFRDTSIFVLVHFSLSVTHTGGSHGTSRSFNTGTNIVHDRSASQYDCTMFLRFSGFRASNALTPLAGHQKSIRPIETDL